MTTDELEAWERTIAWRLKCARLWSGVSQEKAASELKVARQTVASYEASVRHLPLPHFIRLCSIYRVPMMKVLRAPWESWEGEPEGEPPGEPPGE